MNPAANLGTVRPFVVALVVSGLLAWPIYRLLLAARARQTVSQYVAEHQHKQGTPTMGGLIILVGWVAGLGLSPLLALIAGFALIGFLDDFVVPRLLTGKRGLGWGQKLGLQVVVALGGLWLLGARDPTMLALGVFGVLAYSNAYNFTDGLDWLAGTVLVVYAVTLVVLAGPGLVGVVSMALLGGLLPFLVLNKPKAKVFMGDVGSMPIGAFLGVASLTLVWPEVAPKLEARGHVPWLGPVALLGLVLAAELVPPPLQILSVKLRGKRLFPMTPIHHAFQKAGWPETRIVALFFAVQAVCAILAVAWALGVGVPR